MQFISKSLPLLVLLALAFACANDEMEGCIDREAIREDAVCPMIYDPVCGCDGKTYGNACSAGAAGVRSVTPGACPED